MIKVLQELSWFDQTYLFRFFILVLYLPVISPKTLYFFYLFVYICVEELFINEIIS